MSNDTEAATLTEFLLARIAEDEAHARNALAEVANAALGRPSAGVYLRIPPNWITGVADRQLAECEAKRRIMNEVGYHRDGSGDVTPASDDLCESVLRALALPYADHPDYQDEWKP